MPPQPLNLILLDGLFAVAKLPPDAAIPAWASSGQFFAITRTADELSIVCPEAQVPSGLQCEPGWRCVRVAGKMNFSVVLANTGINVFALSTFDTDYLLVKDAVWKRAKELFLSAGRSIR